MSTAYYYVRPTDSLFIRGNLAFGDSGEHGSGSLPPPPSLFAGAFRSAILGRDAEALAGFVQHGRCQDERLAACLGTPTQPGAFRVSWLSLAAQADSQHDGAEALTLLPADLLCLESGFAPLKPRALPAGVESGGELPLRATLASARQEKPTGGLCLRQAGLAPYLADEIPTAAQAVSAGTLHTRDPRLGIGLDTDARSVEKGLIYTTEGFAFSPPAQAEKPSPFATTGFLVGIEGADELLPQRGLLRLGGDGKSAEYRRVDFTPPAVSLNAIARTRHFRLICQTPALSDAGWLLPGVTRQGETYRLQGSAFSARLACAALGRREIVSGWDLFHWKPKDAQVAIPAGSVFWFDRFDGDADKLVTWAANGLQPDTAENTSRRAEGYNLAHLGLWME
jgi:CRISPR-associated protein Cmr3